MFILSQSEVYKTLSEHIDPSSIPKKYGGQLDWAWGDLPNLDPRMVADMQGGSELKLPTGPCRWERSEDGKMRLLAVGSEGGEPRRKPLGTLDRDYEAVFYARQGDHAEPNGNAAPAAAAAHPEEPPRPSTDTTPSLPTEPGPPAST